MFDASVAWLRERQVLLPGVTTLARLVARVREQATQRLWETLSGLLSAEQRYMLDRLLGADERRTSELDRVAPRPGAGVRAADGVGVGPGGGDRRVRLRRFRHLAGAAAAAGGVVALRDGRQGDAVASASTACTAESRRELPVCMMRWAMRPAKSFWKKLRLCLST